MTVLANELYWMSKILENLDDRTVQVAFADWLDERGDPGDAERAELIRVTDVLSRTDPESPSLQELVRRQNELLDVVLKNMTDGQAITDAVKKQITRPLL